MAEQHHLGPLSQEKIRQVIALKNAYSEFWESVKFSKGWDMPVAGITEVLHLLEEAAEIVVRIRTYLDATNSQPKFRILDGSAKEYLWNLEKMPSDNTFIQGLVHATLKNGSVYVEGLTAQRIESFIKDIQNYNSTHQADKLALEGKVLDDNILKAWNETDVIIKLTCAQEDKYWNASLVKDMQQLLNSINNIKQRVTLIQKKRDYNKKKEEQIKEEEVENKRKEAARAEETEQQKAERLEKEKLEAEARAKAEEEARQREEEEARKRAAVTKDREGLLKITSVAKEAAQIEKEIKEISEIAGKVKGIKPLEAMDKITEAKNRCLKNSTKLMQDLLILDELVGLQESRAAKKEQVAHIQHLLDNVETLKSKLSSLEVEIQPLANQQKQDEELDRIADEEIAHMIAEKHQREAKQQQHSEPKPQPHPEPHHEAKSQPHPEVKPQPHHEAKPQPHHESKPVQPEKPAVVHVDHPGRTETPQNVEKTIPIQRRNDTVAHPRFDLKEAWSKIKLDPKIEIFEGDDSYTIMANIPGIHKDEIETTILPDGTLQISGVRVPTQEEINLLRRQIHSRYTPKSDEEEDMLVLKLGVGRFGRFVKKFKLPEGLDIDKIHGQYKDGIVYISVPKPVVQRRQQPPQREVPVNHYPFTPFMNDVPFWNSRYY